MLVFVVAGAGCGAVGALLAISQLQALPAAVFNVQWTAEMAFVTIIGGLGTIEGPIVGTAVYMVLRQTLASYKRVVPDHPRPGGDRHDPVCAARAMGAGGHTPDRAAVPGRLLATAGRGAPA